MVDYDWRGNLIFNIGLTPEVTDQMGEALFLNSFMDEVDRSLLTEEQIAETIVKSRPEIDPQVIRECLARTHEGLNEYPESAPLVRDLKAQGFKVYYLSNYATDNFEMALRDFAFLKEVDGGVVSCDIHVVKPEPGIYTTILERYGLKADECLFFDDRLNNVEAAKRLGFHTWLVETKPPIASIRRGLKYFGIQTSV